MKFIVVDSIYDIGSISEAVVLIVDKWNDWFTYRTMYTMYYINDISQKINIGSIKIGQQNLQEGRPPIESEFNELDDGFFSLGQSEDYYENLNELGGDIRAEILYSLKDMAYNTQLYYKYKAESVMGDSLMRGIYEVTLLGQFNRIAHGGAKLSKYCFSYTVKSEYEWEENIELGFDVIPNSNPPSNIHVLIGRNGVGKTYLLTKMLKSIMNKDNAFVEKNNELDGHRDGRIFANLVYVSFSAFDYEIPKFNKELSNLNYQYIGLKKSLDQDSNYTLKSKDDLTNEFLESINECILNSKIMLWKKIIGNLDSDPIFKEYQFSQLLDKMINKVDAKNNMKIVLSEANKVFASLSSGHKIVLLTLSSLIAKVEERSLVLMDEPELHLHPPLLSAFTRSFSELLINRNGVAIIATHSPVILQEVPQSCVWKLRKFGTDLKAERLERECFGENLGILTSEVFRYEVTNSGVHKLLIDCVDKMNDFDEIMDYFNNCLGLEAQAIVRVLLANKDER